MKTKTITLIAVASLLPIAGFAQTPPTPPVPPAPPVPPVPPAHDMRHERDHDKGPKVPVTFLGIETSEVPTVVSEQLGLAKGFGLVVDYVVPDGPAAAAGVQPNDILKMLNDQILTEPGQLSKLIRSYPEGTNVTLTVLRKGTETKLTAKLAKRDVPGRKDFFGPGFDKRWKSGGNFGMNGDLEGMKEGLEGMKEGLANMHLGDSIRDAVRDARREAMRARDEARRAAREIHVVSRDNGGMKSTTIDLGKAEIVFSDAQGELKIDHASGKKVLTAKDPQGRLVFSGPIETKEELDKVPAEVRARYEKLEQRDLPTVGSVATIDRNDEADEDNDNDADDDNDDADNDDSDNDSSQVSMQQVSLNNFSRRVWDLNAVLI